MDVKQVKALLRLFEAASIHELEVQHGEDRVRLVRSPPNGIAPAAAMYLPQDGNGHGAVEAPVHLVSPQQEGHVVCSPFVGTFYSAPAPEASSFVEIGAVVQVGRVLCIVEAMKLMNEIEAEVSGRIAEIFVENGQPVEYNHPLFRIVPA